MRFLINFIGSVAFLVQGASVANPSPVVSANGSARRVVFNGITEKGVTKSTFLCGDTSVGKAGKAVPGGRNVEADDCSLTAVQGAVGFDVSGGKTLQLFNNFAYWVRQKTKKEQYYKINHKLADDALDRKMEAEGWGSMGAFCIIISTNPVLQKVVAPEKVAGPGAVKVIVQLWYNGGNLIQLWSQDVRMVAPGKGFTIAISNALDAALKPAIALATQGDQYFAAATKVMQPDNRNEAAYKAANDLPRMVRLIAK